MFLSDVQKKEECRNEALQELRKIGIKCRPKKPKQQNVKTNHRIFKVPLKQVPMETVTLITGQQISVPKLVHELCSFILVKVSTEGLFRKEGSKVRQSEMKLVLNGGGRLDKNIHIIDAASLLKTFLRELPEPLIPYTHHELFLRCTLQDVAEFKTESLLLSCLLLPVEHLNTLTYLLQFFNNVAEHSNHNKMDVHNVAVVVAPAIFPLEEKLSQTTAQLRTTKICEIIKILIENALSVGIIPENIIENLGQSAVVDVKKKKRRSGSLTRMFNGLKKIVGGKPIDDHTIVTPDLLLTPINNNVVRKRRIQGAGISQRKKKELVNNLPDNALLSTPFTPCRTPISMDLSGKEHQPKGINEIIKEKKSLWFSRSRSMKNLKQEIGSSKTSLNTKGLLERRWSAINPTNNFKKAKKRNSFNAIVKKESNNENSEPDYIRVSKVEYEAFKDRVSAIERRISIEIDIVQSQIGNKEEEKKEGNLENVQSAYEQTLEQSGQLSPRTDKLARRLSRDLKIRRSGEHKIIRSPSARKIGSMRRKSRELEKSNSNLTRHQSWHVPTRGGIPRISLKRGKPNTVQTGLPQNKLENELIQRPRSSSMGEQNKKSLACNLSGSSNDTWMSAEGFFTTLKSNNTSENINDRASLARLRSQNAGMVLAKAKLFDKLTDSESSSSLTRSIPRSKVGTKIGSSRNHETRLSYRIRALRYEDRKLAKKSMSPKRRNAQLAQRRLEMAKHYLNSSDEKNASDKENIPEKISMTPRIPPYIKRPLIVRSPKRLCRTPARADRGTPLRVLKTPLQYNV